MDLTSAATIDDILAGRSELFYPAARLQLTTYNKLEASDETLAVAIAEAIRRGMVDAPEKTEAGGDVAGAATKSSGTGSGGAATKAADSYSGSIAADSEAPGRGAEVRVVALAVVVFLFLFLLLLW